MSRQVEGRRPVLELLRAGVRIDEILLADSVRGGESLDEIRREAGLRGVPVREVPRAAIDQQARSRAPQGVLARLPAFRYASVDDVLARAEERSEPLLAVAADGVTDPHNLGALARSTEAAGGHGLFVPSRRSASVTPAMEKAAAGALAHLPVAEVDNLHRALERLRERGIWVLALAGEGETSLYEVPVADQPLCLVVGAEGAGVSRLVAERSDLRVRIPMVGAVGSLNASVAGALALFEIARRRTHAD